MAATIQFKRLDVRPLVAAGEEPLPAIRRRLGQLKRGQGLAIVAPFLPAPLIELLGSEGYASRVERAGGAAWIVYFWRSPD